MDLTTRCPQCGTIFQASLSDLQLRKGYIRCIQCSHIFDGYAEVVSDASGDAPVDRAAPVVSAPVDPSSVDTPWVAAPDHWDAEPFAPVSPQVFRSGRDAPAIGSILSQPEGHEEPRAWSVEPPEPFVVEARPGYRGQGGTAAPLLQADESPAWWTRVVRFVAGVLLLALVLVAGAQLVYVYRAQIARTIPSLRPLLEQACVPLRCKVAYARDITKLSITGSALQVQDAAPQASDTGAVHAASGSAPSSPGTDDQTQQRFTLRLTLRNQDDRPQEWPTLVLDLKDSAGTLLVRRNLSPEDYLGADAARQPFAAHGEALVRVPLTLTGLHINGYQLDLFFP